MKSRILAVCIAVIIPLSVIGLGFLAQSYKAAKVAVIVLLVAVVITFLYLMFKQMLDDADKM